MSFLQSESLSIRLKSAFFACGLLIYSAASAAEPVSGPFAGLSGHWSGSGVVTLSNGSAERIRCKANYALHAGGRMVQQTLRCASESYRVEISTNLTSEGNLLTGSWSEATHNLSGSLSGRATESEIIANVAGDGFSARIHVRTHADKQSVIIQPQGDADIAAVSIGLVRM